MFKEIWGRRDTRTEAMWVGAMFLLIVALWFGHRRPRPGVVATGAVSAPLSRTVIGPWTASLIRLETCPQRGITVAVVEVSGSDQGRDKSQNPISHASVAGLTPDGGVWTTAAGPGGSLQYAGAGGETLATRLEPGAGAAVLRFRGVIAAHAATLCLTLPAGRICLPPATATTVSPGISGPVSVIFGR